jgi:outer membrane cobalamin receptor
MMRRRTLRVAVDEEDVRNIDKPIPCTVRKVSPSLGLASACDVSFECQETRHRVELVLKDSHFQTTRVAVAAIFHHSEYGTFFSPRFSALFRHGRWSERVSIGTGFFAPTALTEETETAGLTRLRVAGPLTAERGRSASLDVSRTDGPLTTTFTLFASRIDDSIRVDRKNDYRLRNIDGGTTNAGGEILVTFREPPFAATGTYTYVHAIETDVMNSVDNA